MSEVRGALSAWYCKSEDVPFIVAKLNNPPYIAVENVLPAGSNTCIVLFRGSYPFIENDLKDKYPSIISGGRY